MQTTRLEIVAQIQELLIQQVRSMKTAEDSLGAYRARVKRIAELFTQLRQAQGTAADVGGTGASLEVATIVQFCESVSVSIVSCAPTSERERGLQCDALRFG